MGAERNGSEPVGAGGLWLLATPIGTLDDLPVRAGAVLEGADLVLAEDTRRARTLFGHLGVTPAGPTVSFNEHNEDRRRAEALRVLEAGGRVVLMSDAGTPVLSDPGFTLVREVRRRGLRVLSVPGPSAFTAALAASGQPPLPATLVGFLPPRRGARRRRIEEFRTGRTTLVVLLSPHRLAGELADLAESLGPARPATLLAELSKVHERAEVGTLGELAAGREARSPRGEYVLVVGPPVEAEGAGPLDPEVVEALYREAVRRGLGRAAALRWTAAKVGAGRREVFQALEAASEARLEPEG